MTPLLDARAVTVQYGGVVALDAIAQARERTADPDVTWPGSC